MLGAGVPWAPHVVVLGTWRWHAVVLFRPWTNLCGSTNACQAERYEEQARQANGFKIPGIFGRSRQGS